MLDSARSPKLLTGVLLGLLAFARLACGENLLPNADFESGNKGWSLFVPAESEGKGCALAISRDTVHGGASSIRMKSDAFARYALNAPKGISVHPGERYRISFWIRADQAFVLQPERGSIVVRVLLRQNAGHEDVPENKAIYIGLNGKTSLQSSAHGLNLAPLQAPVPTQWTQVSAVVEMPAIPELDMVGLSWFAWYTKGEFFLDDITVEKVDAQTPLSPTASAESAPRLPGPVTTDDQIIAALNLDAPGLAPVNKALAAHDLTAAKEAYLAYRRSLSPARFFLMPKDQPAAAVEQNDPAADEVCRHVIRDTYYGFKNAVDMGRDFNWTYNPVPKNSPDFTDEYTWCVLGRTQFWKTLADAYWKTHDEKYAREWAVQLADFARKNRYDNQLAPGEPSLWRTLEAGIRMRDSWPYVYYHFLSSPEFTPDAQWLYLKLMQDHAQYLLRGLQNPSRTGNWVTTECLGLYTIGALFPELTSAASWREVAVQRLMREADRCILPDGFEAELTPNYHYVTLEDYADLLKLAKLNNLPVPTLLTEKIRAMYRAPVMVMDQSGNNVPTNDSQIVSAARKAREGLEVLGDDPLLRWAATGGKEGQQPPDSTMLPYAGFYAMRSGWKRPDLFLFFRGGPTGLAHEHEDMLEVVLRAWNRTLLFDPGTYSYNHSDWRRFATGTASHNTIIVDGKWQHRGESSVQDVKPQENPWVTSAAFDYVAATYRGGYQQNVYDPTRQYRPEKWVGPVDHSITHTRRVLFLKPYYALIVDTLDGTGTHTFDAHFHLDAPAARQDESTQAAFSQNSGSVQVGLYPLDREHLTTEIIQGQKESLLGWMPSEHRPIPTVRFRKVQEAPAAFATLLFPYRQKSAQESAPNVTAAALPMEGRDLWAQTLTTPFETVDICLRKESTPDVLSFTSSVSGKVQVTAAGMVIRQQREDRSIVTGAWELTRYQDAHLSFTLAGPGTLLWQQRGDQLLLCNATARPIAFHLTAPFTLNATLPANQWVAVARDGVQPLAAPPVLFSRHDVDETAISYARYLEQQSRLHPAATAPRAEAVHIPAESLTLPPSMTLRTKIGAKGKVAVGWDNPGMTLSVPVPAAGWYRIKIRYCAQGDAVRSLLINGEIPFAEAEGFELASTQGAAPSDGWSNYTSDWKEIVLGSETTAGGWKCYLPQGTLALRNEAGGGANVDWIDLMPDHP